MSDEPQLRQAWVLYKQGRFASALESLESKVFQFRENPEFFRILGLCCLRLGDWKGGETYLQRSQQLDPDVHRDTLLGLMAVAARRNDYGEAIQYSLEILDRNPGDKAAKRGLSKLRAVIGAADSSVTLDRSTLGQWLPPFKKRNPAIIRWCVRGIWVAGVAGCLAAGAWWGLSLVGGLPSMEEARQGPPTLKSPLPGVESPQAVGSFSLTLTPAEIQAGWERAQKAFQEYHDSQARFEINKLLLSNAAASVKVRARSLLPYLHDPDFARPDDSSGYDDVKASPSLYEGCTVRWSGVLTNLISGDKKISFDLLLGYQDGQVVQGIVPVELAFAALLKNSQVVEVLGKVVIRGGQWLVQGTSLRNLGYRAP